jgi:hypothetical protein
MPIPPILDVYVVWHPDDASGRQYFDQLHEHFHGPAFAGLVGGAVEVYARSLPWAEDGAPRALGESDPTAEAVPPAQFKVIVPVLSIEMARAAADRDSGWRRFVGEISDLTETSGCGVYSVPNPAVNLADGALAEFFGPTQTLPSSVRQDPEALALELGQAITQQIFRSNGDGDRLTVFVSHSKHRSLLEDDDSPAIFADVRARISSSHLGEFFDAVDIQPGSHWADELRGHAATSALLIVRTDRYAEREWTQWEVLAAKTADMPVVSMYALHGGEERGSFLMDHVPTVVCDIDNRDRGVAAALQSLVSESLKSALWRAQRSYLGEDGFDWLPGRSPEPTTLGPWLRKHKKQVPEDSQIWIMHPDPPLGPAERQVLIELCELSGYSRDVQIFTPRTFAARGGEA